MCLVRRGARRIVGDRSHRFARNRGRRVVRDLTAIVGTADAAGSDNAEGVVLAARSLEI